MTTAHRPTWKPAVGGSEQGGNKITVPTRQYSSKDIPGYTTLKHRIFKEEGPKAKDNEDIIKDKEKEDVIQEKEEKIKDIPLKKIKKDYSDRDRDRDEESDENINERESQSGDESENDSLDDSDDELLLMREFEKIKKEREQLKSQ